MFDLHSRWPHLEPPSRTRVAEWLLHATDIGLVGVFFVTALMLGGRHDAGRLVYTLSVALATLSLAARTAILRRPLQTPRWPICLAALAIAIPVSQLLPLPPDALAIVAPGHESLLPMWTADSPLGAWPTVSLAPRETLEGAALLVTHALLFFVLINRLESASDIRRLLLAIGLAALAMAALAVVQSLNPNGKLLWVYDYPYYRFRQSVQGAFANKNHLAHYLAFGVAAFTPLVVGSLGATASRSSHRERPVWSPFRWFVVGTVVFLLVTLLATMSRGGVAAMTIGMLVAMTIRWCVSGFRLNEAVALAGLGCVVLIAVSSFDYDRVTGRLNDLVSGEIEQLDANRGRRLIWEANVEAFAANPWLGHGAGSHRYVYPAYFDEPSTKEYTHAESGYLQIASESGVAGLLALLMGLTTAGWWVTVGLTRAHTPERVLLGSCLAGGLAVSATHSVVDFVWYVPSLCALVIAFAAIAYRLTHISDGEGNRRDPYRSQHATQVSWWRLGGAAIAAPAAAACLMGPATGSFTWDRYLRVSKTTATLRREALESLPEVEANREATIRENELRAFRLLSEVLEADPGNARANSRFANRCVLAFGGRVAQGDNPMTLDLIRDAAINGGFGSVKEVREWTSRAFGDSMSLLAKSHRHARLAAMLCPLEANAYLHGASLAFVTGERVSLDRWIDQAIRLRPQDGGVRYEAARLLHAEGRFDEAIGCYRTSLRMPGSHRNQLVATLASLMPARVFLESLEPDNAATELVFAAYQQLGSQEDLVAIAQHAEQAALASNQGTPQEKARCWRQLSMINRAVERFEAAVDCAKRAEEASPYDFWVRHELALAMSRAERFDEAEPHLRWCLARRPDLRYLQLMLKQGAKQRGEAERLAREKQRFEARLAALSKARQQAESDSHDDPVRTKRVE